MTSLLAETKISESENNHQALLSSLLEESSSLLPVDEAIDHERLMSVIRSLEAELIGIPDMAMEDYESVNKVKNGSYGCDSELWLGDYEVCDQEFDWTDDMETQLYMPKGDDDDLNLYARVEDSLVGNQMIVMEDNEFQGHRDGCCCHFCCGHM